MVQLARTLEQNCGGESRRECCSKSAETRVTLRYDASPGGLVIGKALSTPDTSEDILRRRLMCGQTFAVTDLALEFGVSGDTIRRDLLPLEAPVSRGGRGTA